MAKLIFVIRRPVRLVGLILLLVVICVVPSTPVVEAQSPTLPLELEKVRAALDKYQDPFVAVHDGYRSTLGCVEYPAAGSPGHVPYPPGGMGVHFAHVRPVGPEPDPMRPNILVYEPDGDKLRLVAAEWLIPLATGIKGRPQLFGQPFDGPMEGHYPLMPLAVHHYDLHVLAVEGESGRPVQPDEPQREVQWIRLSPAGGGAQAGTPSLIRGVR